MEIALQRKTIGASSLGHVKNLHWNLLFNKNKTGIVSRVEVFALLQYFDRGTVSREEFVSLGATKAAWPSPFCSVLCAKWGRKSAEARGAFSWFLLERVPVPFHLAQSRETNRRHSYSWVPRYVDVPRAPLFDCPKIGLS